MNRIVCYRRGCNHPAKYELPGQRAPLHLCRQCLLDLYPNANVVYSVPACRPQVGPTEYKVEKLSEEAEQAEAARLLVEARRLRDV